MPKLKLRSYQFLLMHEAMNDLCEKEKRELHALLCEVSGLTFEYSYTEIEHHRLNIIEKYRELKEICLRKIQQYKDKSETGLSESDARLFANWSIQITRIEEVLYQISEKHSRILELTNIARIIKEKSENKDFWPGYDDDDHDSDDKPEMDPDEWERRTDALVY